MQSPLLPLTQHPHGGPTDPWPPRGPCVHRVSHGLQLIIAGHGLSLSQFAVLTSVLPPALFQVGTATLVTDVVRTPAQAGAPRRGGQKRTRTPAPTADFLPKPCSFWTRHLLSWVSGAPPGPPHTPHWLWGHRAMTCRWPLWTRSLCLEAVRPGVRDAVRVPTPTGPPPGPSPADGGSGHRASICQGDILGACGGPGKCAAGVPTARVPRDPQGSERRPTVAMTDCTLLLRVCGAGREGWGSEEGSGWGHVIEKHVSSDWVLGAPACIAGACGEINDTEKCHYVTHDAVCLHGPRRKPSTNIHSRLEGFWGQIYFFLMCNHPEMGLKAKEEKI